MAFPNKTKIPTAVEKMTEMDLSGVHITTSNFMQLDVAKCMELVPKQSVDINHLVFARLEPLVAPTFGLAQIHKKAFFVPFRTIFPAWNDFENDTMHVFSDGKASVVTTVPYVNDSVFVNTLIRSEYATESTQLRSDFTVTKVDIYPEEREVTFIPYVFTNKGKRIFKMLTALGYKFTFTLDNDAFFTNQSLLPLFALAKVYLDWYYPNQYVQDATSTNVEKWLKSDINFNYSLDFTSDDLSDFFEIIDRVCYNNDYLTSAWDNPTTPNQGAKSIFNINDFTTSGYEDIYSNKVSSELSPFNQAASPVISSTRDYSAINPVSQYALTALKSLSDYLKRHQIAGSRAIDRFLSRWGIQLPNDKLNRSLYIGGSNQDVDFGDVTSTASTEGAALGDYAGKGVSFDDNIQPITFDATERGMLLILTSIVPRTSYYQGALRHTMHITKLDFFTPEFDNLGVQPILRREVYLPMNTKKNYVNETPAETVNFAEDIFGFAPRYAEYKKGDDILSGDYILDSKNVGKDAWNLFRNLDPLFANKGSNAVKHSINFVNASDSEQYNRIFTVTDTSFDKFNIIHKFDIKTRFPGHSLYDDYEFSSQDKAPDVTLNTGSVKAN